MEPEVQCRIHKGSPIIPILSRINPITRINPINTYEYLFKVHSNTGVYLFIIYLLIDDAYFVINFSRV